jgi:uncharacterized protein
VVKTKKALLGLALLLALALALAPAALAADKSLVVDDMGKISAARQEELNTYANQISDKYNMDVAFFLSTHDYAPEQKLGVYTREYWSDAIQDGFVLAHDVDGKIYTFVGFGEAEGLLTDSTMTRLWAAYNNKDADDTTYYGGAMAYLQEAEKILNQAAAAPADGSARTIDLVTDDAYLLTDEQWEALNARAEQISATYKCDVAIITLESMGEYTDAYEFAKYLHQEYNFGWGKTKRSAMFVQITAERDYAFIEYGTDDAFTDYGREKMLDNFILPQLKQDNYYEAYVAFLDRAEYYLGLEAAGTPFDVGNDPEQAQSEAMGMFIAEMLFAIFFPLWLAWFLTKRWKKKMLTAVAATGAHQYIPAGGVRLTRQEDQFLYMTETRTKIERNDSSDSGGGTSRDSDGYSGSSGKY